MSTVKVNNKRASLVTLPPVAGYSGGAVQLKPGINDVDEGYIEAFSKMPGVEGPSDPFDTEYGCLEIAEGGDPLIAPDAKTTLTSMNVTNSVSMIESCTDEAQLAQWNKTDNRKGVHDAIAKRTAELAKASAGATDPAVINPAGAATQ